MGDEKQHLEDAHFNKFKSKIDKVTSLKMNLDIIPGDECNSVSGQSVLHIGKENYSFTVEGTLDTFNINDKTVFYGPVFGKLKNKQKEDSTIIGLYYDPSTDTTIASLSVGDLSKDGVTLMLFGEKNTDYSDLIAQMNSNIKNNSIVNNGINNSKEKVEGLLAHSASTYTTMNSALGDYTYVNSASSKWLSNKDGYYQIIDSPPNSEILNYTGKYMIILETYKGDLDNSIINRVWTNSSAVKSFIGAQNAGVYSIYTWFGSDRGNINIYNVGPANGNSIKIPSYLDYVAKFLKANGYWTYIKSIMNWYFANSVDVGTINEFRKTQNGRIYQDGKFIRRVDKQADVIYEPTDLTSFAQNNGGASFNFDYNSYGTSKSLTSGAQVVYTVFHDGYNAFLWSDKVYNSWTQ